MELTLMHQTKTQISVICDDQLSHDFDLPSLLLKDEKELLDDPVAYGKKLYEALFPQNTLAQREMADQPSRLLLVTTDDDIDAIPWEYAYGPDGFLVLECPFVRGLPAEQRIMPSALDGSLHIIAVPSNPLSREIEPLNIDGEWTRLKEIIQEVSSTITLERARPSTLARVRELVVNRKGGIVHFMGHGKQDERGALLCFEKENGALDEVVAKQFMQRVRTDVFLVTLNACMSAKPGPTPFSNLAAALMHQKMPYALGMRLSIYDDDAHIFSRTFYSELAHGTFVEEAVFQARLTLSEKSSRPWVIGVPVLYTALAAPTADFTSSVGTPTIKEHQPPVESSMLLRAEGTFQGRIEELQQLGTYLTGDNRPLLVTIHGGGGQGKTALAREAIERFAYAWPGGVWATTLEKLPSRATFVTDLARFLSIPTQETLDSKEVERQVFARLALRRTLIVLDNAETLIEAVERNDETALRLVELIKQLPRSSVSLLVTSRVQLEWSGEVSLELGGLTPKEGADLFIQCTPQRVAEVETALAKHLSEKLEGHPLSLRLLGGAFNKSPISLSAFISLYETKLVEAENKYVGPEHKHRKLYACIETSVRYLDANLRSFLSGLWIFHAPFLAQVAVAIFDPEAKETEQTPSPVQDSLHVLWQRGLLTRIPKTTRDETLQFYYLLPTTRPYVEHHMEQVNQRKALLERFGITYAKIAAFLYNNLNTNATTITIAQQSHEDFERGIEYVTGIEQGHYLLFWGRVLYRLGYSHDGLEVLQRALKIVQGQDQALELHVLSNIAAGYQRIGKPQEALELLDQVLSITQEMGDRGNEATTLSSMATVYGKIGQPHEALHLFEQALPLLRDVGHRVGEATTLYSIAEAYQRLGQPQEALKLLEQALPITREVGDRVEEAAVLNNMAYVYLQTGQTREALHRFEQALSITQEVDVADRVTEANILNNIALVYSRLGQPQEALKCYEQKALPLMREVGDRAGEANILINMGGIYQSIGQPQEALKRYEQALSITQEVHNRVGEAATRSSMAVVYRIIGQRQKALTLLEQALSSMQEIGDRDGEATTLNNMGSVYESMGQLQKALQFHEQALSIRREIGDHDGEATTLNNMGSVYESMGQPQEARKRCEQALSIMQDVGNRAGEATVLSHIGVIYGKTGQPQEALRLLERALPIIREVGDRSGEASTLNTMGEAYRAVGQPQEALKLLEQALSIRQEVGDRAGEATTLNNIGMVYQSVGQPLEARKWHEQALPIMQEVGDRAAEANILNNIGLVYAKTGQPQEALRVYEQILPILREVGDRAGEATNLANKATVYQRIGQLQEALRLYEQALPIMQEVSHRAGEVMILNNMGGVYLRIGQLQEALRLFEQALPITQEIGDRAAEANTLSNIATVYVDTGQLQEALKRYEQALLIRQEVGDHAGEAITLHGMAYLYQIMQRYTEALTHFEMSVELARQAADHADEVAGLVRMAFLLYQHLNRPQDAIARIEQALTVFKETGLPRDLAGNTPADVQRLLQIMRASASLGKASKQVQQVVTKATQTWQKFFKRSKNE